MSPSNTFPYSRYAHEICQLQLSQPGMRQKALKIAFKVYMNTMSGDPTSKYAAKSEPQTSQLSSGLSM